MSLYPTAETPPSLPPRRGRLLPFIYDPVHFPWWALVAALLGVIIAWGMANNRDYRNIFETVAQGIPIAIVVTFVAFTSATLLGLLIALGRVSSNVWAYQISTFYVEIIRGLPTLVLLLYVAFVLVPLFVEGTNGLGRWLIETGVLVEVGQALTRFSIRQVDNALRAVIALALSYSAFIAEIFRAGIQSVDPGQFEAARALGMTHWQAMFHIVLRQAVRQALPPLGNDFVAMLKDSSLVSAIGVQDITGRTRTTQASTFLTFESYNVMAYQYLVMTLLLSLGVKMLERRMARERRKQEIA